MDRMKGLAKGGWHPKNDPDLTKRPSARGEFKGINQVAGWVGKGKSESPGPVNVHSAAPLSTLKDPASFGPPPKHVAFHGQEAVNTTTVPKERSPVPPRSTATASLQKPYRPGSQSQQEDQETEQLAPPPIPSRRAATSPAARSQAKPAPPPRLPPRQNSHPDEYSIDPPPAYNDTVSGSVSQSPSLNQAAMNRLGQAGVSVPGLNINRTTSPRSTTSPLPPPRTNTQPTATPSGGQANELQSRFSRLKSASPLPSPAASTPLSSAQSQTQVQSTGGGGNTWAQKQSAMRTASSIHKDPSSVSISDARDAAGTANSFRQRHREQVKGGLAKANGLGQKYGVADRVKGATGVSPAPSPALEQESGVEEESETCSPVPSEGRTLGSSVAGKKPPPPPPPKKRNFAPGGDSGMESDGASSAGAPPPIPLASKPR